MRVDVVPVPADSPSLQRLVSLARAEAAGRRGGVALVADLETRWVRAYDRAVFLGRIDAVDVGFVAVGLAVRPAVRPALIGDVPASGSPARDAGSDTSWEGVAGETGVEGPDADLVFYRSGRPAERTDSIAWVVGPWVEPGARGVGVGEALVAEVQAWASAAGAGRLDAFALPGDRETKSAFERAGLVTRALVLSPRAAGLGRAGSGWGTAEVLLGSSPGTEAAVFSSAAPDTPGSGTCELGPSGAGDGPGPIYELAVGGLLVEDGRCLLVRRERPPGAGLWSLPGGRVEPDETPERAVVREMEEETGLVVSVEGLVGCAERPGVGPGRRYAILDYRVRRVAGELRAASDAVEARLVGRAELDGVSLVAGLREFLEEHGLLSLLI